MNWYACADAWSFILRRYLPRLALCSLAWEVAQLPLYTLWDEPRLGWIVFALAHCTAGDVAIGAGTLLLALAASRARAPAEWPRTRVGAFMVVFALAYTVASEHINLARGNCQGGLIVRFARASEYINLARGNWAYSPWMPLLPWLEVGLAPMAQWIVVPLAAWRWAKRQTSQRPT